MSKEQLINKFAENIIKQNQYIENGNSREGNICAKKYISAFKTLVDLFGDEGRESLSRLFNHDNEGVRQMTAAFLLKYKTNEAKKVLEELVKRKGLISFNASETLKRWEEGTWSLDK